MFWLSLVPFVTTWPVALYGEILLMAGLAYFFLTRSLISHHGKESLLAEAVGRDRKGIASLILYILGIGLSFIHPYIGFGLYVLVATIWFIPGSRFEKKLSS